MLPDGALRRPQVRGNVDVLCIMPCLAVVLGLAAAFFGSKTRAPPWPRSGATAVRPLVLAAVADVLLACAAVAYCLCVNFGKAAEGWRRALLRVVGVLAALFACASGLAHLAAPEPSWATLATPLQMLGFSLLGGSALVTLMLEKAGALDDPSVKRSLTLPPCWGPCWASAAFPPRCSPSRG